MNIPLLKKEDVSDVSITKELMLMTEDDKYSSLEFIRQSNPILCIAIKDLHKKELEKSQKNKIKRGM